MDIADNLMFIINRLDNIMGARPDAAVIFMIFFIGALSLCIRISHKNHLFCSYDKGMLKNAADCESTK